MGELRRSDIDASDRTSAAQTLAQTGKVPFWKKVTACVLITGALGSSSCGGPYSQLPDTVRAGMENDCRNDRRCELDRLAGIAAGETTDPAVGRRILATFEGLLTGESSQSWRGEVINRLDAIILSEHTNPELRGLAVEMLERIYSSTPDDDVRLDVGFELANLYHSAPQLLSDEYWYRRLESAFDSDSWGYESQIPASSLAIDGNRGPAFRGRMISLIERGLDHTTGYSPESTFFWIANNLTSLISIAANEVTEPQLRRQIEQYCFDWMAMGHKTLSMVFASEADARAYLATPAGLHTSYLNRDELNQPEESVRQFGNELFDKIRTEWLSREYLGAVIYDRFVAIPPVLVLFGEALLGIGELTGKYIEETNCVGITTGALTEDGGKRMAHELLHYASYLGGGVTGIRWISEDNEPVVRESIPWLHEGLTELHAQQLAREHGHVPSTVVYPSESIFSFYLQQLVGADVLRAAYLSGDFTEVRRNINARLGEGTFEHLLQEESYSMAFEFLVRRLDKAGISHSEWDRNPMVRDALRQMESMVTDDERDIPVMPY